MSKFLSFFFVIFLLFFSISYSQVGNEFPIEVGSDSCFASSFSQDATKYMIVMRKDKGFSNADIVVQFHSKLDHSLIYGPIVIGTTNVPISNFESALPQAAFDGTRFLVVWVNNGINYRFINAQTFELSQIYSDATLPLILGGTNLLHFNPVTNRYLIVFGIKTQQDNIYLAYNFIQRNGSLGNTNQLVSFPVRKEISLSYANGKYLVCFIKDNSQGSDFEVYGQLLNEDGTISGSTFLVDGSSYPSDNPLFVTFDGKYHLCFYTDEEPTGWKIYAKRISPTGGVDINKSLISADGHLVPEAIVANSLLLVTWTKFPVMGISPGYVKGRFFDLNLNPIGNEFIVFNEKNGKTPIGGTVVFGDNKFYCYSTRMNFSIYVVGTDTMFILTNGDVFGVPIFSPTEVKDEQITAEQFELFQNYPNPFNPSTIIKFNLTERGYCVLKLFDLVGNEIETIFDAELDAGLHSVDFEPSRFNLSSGVYVYELKFNSLIQTRKMVYLK
ncbi:MAG: hypothetical protein N3F03_02545 [Ignavibacteria bacterium]|nr:hypothetical protein [Ignavibacteria bacterium]